MSGWSSPRTPRWRWSVSWFSVAGFGVAAELPERPGEIVPGHQRVQMIRAKPVAPLLPQVVHETPRGSGIAALDQVPAHAANKLAQCRAVGGAEVGGQHVRHQLRPPRPGAGIGRVTGIASRQDRFGALARGGGAGGGQPVAEDGLGEPVHLQPAVIDAGQRLCRHVGKSLPPGQRVGGRRRQLGWQRADGAGEQVLGNRLWCQERAQAGEFSGGRVPVCQPVRQQSGGGCQRSRVRARRTPVKQLPGPGPQQDQVLARQRAGVGDESGGLRDGERQVAKLGG